ncbi:MAG: trehalose 6-phosphate synthase [Actinomycetota bacterium]
MPQSLREFYALMHSTVPIRRELTAGALAGEAPAPASIEMLRSSLDQLEAVPVESDGRPLTLDGGGTTYVDLGYEIDGLQKDLYLAEEGEVALRELLSSANEWFDEQVRIGLDALSSASIDTLLTDRDGTVNNYCGRYASSVQSVYNATYLSRFARTCVRNAVILTSAPLSDVGLADLAVTPPGDLILAGSKGREYLDRHGVRRRDAVDAAKQELLDDLNRQLQHVLADPEYAVFGMIGSGLQFKFGQTTIARQDIDGSIDAGRSAAFADTIADLIAGIDPDGTVLRIEDTGLDLELILTVDDAAGSSRDFDKGDGVRFLDRELGLGVADGGCLVCGDTAADVPMLAAVAEISPETHAVFVTDDDTLRATVRDVVHDAVFVSRPDTLVALLDALSRS